MMNTMQTGLLLASPTGIVFALGYLDCGTPNMDFAILTAAATNFVACRNSGKAVLAIQDEELVAVKSGSAPIHRLGELGSRVELPMPKISIDGSDRPNTFATSRNRNPLGES